MESKGGKMMEYPPILDVTCGNRAMWYNKENPLCLFCDIRDEEYYSNYESNHGSIKIHPDRIEDFTRLSFPDNTFKLVVWDPPHAVNRSMKSWLIKMYGTLGDDWQFVIKTGFHECMRVLKPGGFLVFKWCEIDVTVKQIISVIETTPLFGHQSGKQSKTHWMMFMKE